jgi:hypothetical protein
MKPTLRAKFLVNKPVHGVKAGTELTLAVDENGTPLERQWRRRLKDAKIDNCISRVSVKSASVKPKKVPDTKPEDK